MLKMAIFEHQFGLKMSTFTWIGSIIKICKKWQKYENFTKNIWKIAFFDENLMIFCKISYSSYVADLNPQIQDLDENVSKSAQKWSKMGPKIWKIRNFYENFIKNVKNDKIGWNCWSDLLTPMSRHW